MRCNRLLLWCLLPSLGYALEITDVVANVLVPIGTLGHSLALLSLVLAAGFAVMSIYTWRQHRDNPTFTPFQRVTWMVFFTICFCILYLMHPSAQSTIGTRPFSVHDKPISTQNQQQGKHWAYR